MTTLRYLRFPKQEDRGGGKRRDNNISSLPFLCLTPQRKEMNKIWASLRETRIKGMPLPIFTYCGKVATYHKGGQEFRSMTPDPLPSLQPLMPHGCVFPGETFIPPCFSSSHRRNRRGEVSQSLSPSSPEATFFGLPPPSPFPSSLFWRCVITIFRHCSGRHQK